MKNLAMPLSNIYEPMPVFPSLFPAKLRGSCANLFLNVIRKQDIREPILLSKTIAEELQKKESFRKVEKILIMAMHSNLEDVIQYADNRILWEQLTPEDKKLSRTAKARETHVYLMRKEIEYLRNSI